MTLRYKGWAIEAIKIKEPDSFLITLRESVADATRGIKGLRVVPCTVIVEAEKEAKKGGKK